MDANTLETDLSARPARHCRLARPTDKRILYQSICIVKHYSLNRSIYFGIYSVV